MFQGTVAASNAIELPRQRLAEELAILREENARLEAALHRTDAIIAVRGAALHHAANSVAITNREGIIVWVNPAFTRLTGYTLEEISGKTFRILKSGKHDKAFYTKLWKTISQGETWHGLLTNRRKDGSLYHGEQTITPVRTRGRKITHFIGIMNDVTARLRAEEELRLTHEKLRYLLAHNPAVFYALTIQEGERVSPYLVSETISDLLGFSVEESCHSDWWYSHLHPEDRERAAAHPFETLRTGFHRCEYRLQHKDGTYRWVEDSERLVRDSSGRPKEISGVWLDITTRKQLEREIELREQSLNSFFAGATAGLAMLDNNLRYVRVNETLAQINGVPVPEHIGRPISEVLPLFAPIVEPLLREVLATGRPILNVELSGEVPGEPGVIRNWVVSHFPMTGPDQKVQSIGAIVVEITDRIRAEEALRQSEEKFRQLAENISDVFWITTADRSKIIYVSPAFEKVWGRPVAALHENPREWSDAIHPEDRPAVLKFFEQLVRGGAPATMTEYQTPNGAARTVLRFLLQRSI